MKGKPCKFRPNKLCKWARCPFRITGDEDSDGCWREKAGRALKKAVEDDRDAIERLRECVDGDSTTPPEEKPH